MSRETRTRTKIVNRISESVSYRILDIDIECMNEKNCCSPSGEIILCKHDDAPEFLRGNPFVVHGYRNMLPFALCLKSLFTWNNDTVNIWTHLLGFFIFFFILIHDNATMLSKSNNRKHLVDQMVMSAGLLCYQYCLFSSTGYHIFRCHSSKACFRWLSLDLTGILIGILGCYLPGIHFGFYCLSVWRDVYLIVIGLLFITVFCYQTSPRFLLPSWNHARVLLYTSLILCGVVPACHWIYLNGGWKAEVVQVFAPKLLVVYLLGAVALGFYVTRFPERCFPGKFDYIGSSHQLWHIIVVIVFLWWHHSGAELIRYHSEHPCEG